MFARGEIALSLARAGFYIFPGMPGGKKPAIKRWTQHATRDEKTIRGWWSVVDYNICILCGLPDGVTEGKFLVVVDYDGKTGKHGLDTYLKHTAAGLLDTMRVKTPNGVHAYFHCDAPVPNSVSRLAQHVDVRGTHGYVVGPGSAIANKGGSYEWIKDSHELPQQMPAELLTLANTRSETERPENVTELDSDLLDSPRALERAKTYIINEAPEAIEGNGGDMTTFTVAQRIRAFGVSKERCYEMMLDHYNDAKCSPPWEADDLRKKVENAYKYAKLPPGNANPELEFAPAISGLGLELVPDMNDKDHGSTQGVRRQRSGVLTFLDMTGWDNDQLPEIDWAVWNLIMLQEVGLFTGVGGAGKSIIELMKCVCHVMGIPWLGMPVRKGPVIYVGAEESEKILKIRLMLIARYYNVKFADLVRNGLQIWALGDAKHPPVLCRPNDAGIIVTTELYQDLYDWAAKNKPVSIVLDPLTHIYAGSEIDRVQVYTAIHHLRQLAKIAFAAVTILGHPSLQGIASGSGVSGSTAWHAAVRYRYYLSAAPKKKKDDDDDSTPDRGMRWLKFMKNQYGPPAAHLPLQWSDGVFVNITELQRREREMLIEDVFMALLVRYTREGRVVTHKTRTANYAPSQFIQEDEAEAVTADELADAMRRLIRDGKVRIEPHVSQWRHKVERLLPVSEFEAGGSVFD